MTLKDRFFQGKAPIRRADSDVSLLFATAYPYCGPTWSRQLWLRVSAAAGFELVQAVLQGVYRGAVVRSPLSHQTA